MKPELSVELLGIKFANPFLLASTGATRADKWPRIARAGWAGGMTWAGECFPSGIILPRFYSPSMHIDKDDREAGWSCQLFTAQATGAPIEHEGFSVELLGERVRKAKQSGLPVGANILLGTEVKPWVHAAKVAEAAGADFLELNLSCPVRPWGLYFHRDLTVNAEIVRSVRRVTRLPLVAKLHAWILPEELKELAVTVVNAGADAISTTNIFLGMVGIDIDSGLPWTRDIDSNGDLRGPVSPFSGPVIKPLGLRAVAEVASVVDVPIMGMGGIADWQSTVEYMMAGASMVQVGTAAMLFGYSMVREMVEGLESFMESKGYERPQDFIGLSRRMVTGLGEKWTSAAVDTPHSMMVDKEKCNGCGICVPGCIATANGAIKLRDGIARINDKLCIRCNVCRLVCPNKAIYPVERNTATP